MAGAYQLGRCAAHRRLLVATVLGLEARVTGTLLDTADKLIGGLFAKACNAKRRRHAATATDVGRLIRLFHGPIDALAIAQGGNLDAFERATARRERQEPALPLPPGSPGASCGRPSFACRLRAGAEQRFSPDITNPPITATALARTADRTLSRPHWSGPS